MIFFQFYNISGIFTSASSKKSSLLDYLLKQKTLKKQKRYVMSSMSKMM